MSLRRGLVILIGSNALGRGDEELGQTLMPRFLHELAGASEKPEAVLFVNYGVRLVADDSPALEQLRRLQEGGAELLACSTCLARFDLMDRVAVGSKSNMAEIVSTLVAAGRVVSL